MDSLLQDVPRETRDALTHYEQRLRDTNAVMNLVSPATLDQMWDRHFVDSAQLKALKPEARTWLDLGSGGGFPGIVLAILLKNESGHIDLVESTGKKARFLEDVARELRLPAKVWNERIEKLGRTIPTPQVVTARALARLPLLLQLAEPWLAAGAVGLFPKGRNFQAEVDESHTQWRFSMVKHRSTTDGDSAILEITDLRRA